MRIRQQIPVSRTIAGEYLKTQEVNVIHCGVSEQEVDPCGRCRIMTANHFGIVDNVKCRILVRIDCEFGQFRTFISKQEIRVGKSLCNGQSTKENLEVS